MANNTKYCTDLIITYNYYDDFFHESNLLHNIDLSIIDEEDKTPYVCDFLYKSELVGAFKLETFCPVTITDCIKELHDRMSECSEFAECMKIGCEKIFSEDDYCGLVLLFSYDYFFATHRCICEYLAEGRIKSETLAFLKNLLSK